MSRRRQLNEEETRIYAAGMAAARRGETRPKQELPRDEYKLWRAGWRRIGMTPHSNSVMRSGNHNTLCEGMHCIHTEVETFDDALKVIDMRQRAKVSSQTLKARPPNWRQELGAHNGRKNSPVGKALLPAQADRISEFERHIVGRVLTAIGELKLGVEEMSTIAAMGTRFPALNPKSLIHIVTNLCHLIRQDVPDFNVARKPMHQLRFCISCAAELAHNELDYCRHCNPTTEHLRIAAQLELEHRVAMAGAEREVQRLDRTIKRMSRVIDHGDDQGHGGYPGQVIGDLETGGREKNVVVGSETSHQSGTSGVGDAES